MQVKGKVRGEGGCAEGRQPGRRSGGYPTLISAGDTFDIHRLQMISSRFCTCSNSKMRGTVQVPKDASQDAALSY